MAMYRIYAQGAMGPRRLGSEQTANRPDTTALGAFISDATCVGKQPRPQERQIDMRHNLCSWSGRPGHPLGGWGWRQELTDIIPTASLAKR